MVEERRNDEEKLIWDDDVGQIVSSGRQSRGSGRSSCGCTDDIKPIHKETGLLWSPCRANQTGYYVSRRTVPDYSTMHFLSRPRPLRPPLLLTYRRISGLKELIDLMELTASAFRVAVWKTSRTPSPVLAEHST